MKMCTFLAVQLLRFCIFDKRTMASIDYTDLTNDYFDSQLSRSELGYIMPYSRSRPQPKNGLSSQLTWKGPLNRRSVSPENYQALPRRRKPVERNKKRWYPKEPILIEEEADTDDPGEYDSEPDEGKMDFEEPTHNRPQVRNDNQSKRENSKLPTTKSIRKKKETDVMTVDSAQLGSERRKPKGESENFIKKRKRNVYDTLT